MVNNIRINLTDEEYNVLNHITSATKTDCWFWLETDNDGNDYVQDLEEDCELTLQEGIGQLYEAVDFMTLNDWEELGINEQEIAIFAQLLEKLEII